MEKEWQLTEDEYLDKAITCYKRWCTRNGYRFQIPAGGGWFVSDDEIELANVHGTLRKYKAYPDGRIKAIPFENINGNRRARN
jgi:hypothetical protein